MCAFCEACLGKKHIKNSRYNLCDKCLSSFKGEYREYKKNVPVPLTFKEYIDMALLATEVNSKKNGKKTLI